MRFLHVDNEHLTAFMKQSTDLSNTVVGAVALSRDAHDFWLPLGDVEVSGNGTFREPVALENLVTGERIPVEWGGVRLWLDPERDPALLFRCLT